MSRSINLVWLIAAAVVSAGLSLQAGAHEPASGAPTLLSLAERQVIEARRDRQHFQARQQQLRELDRLANGAPQPRLDVPVFRPGRQLPTSGNSYIK